MRLMQEMLRQQIERRWPQSRRSEHRLICICHMNPAPRWLKGEIDNIFAINQINR
jgi:hypothetical protein